MVWNRGWITKLVDSKTEDGGTKVLVQRSSDTDDSTDFSADVEIECEIFQVHSTLLLSIANLTATLI